MLLQRHAEAGVNTSSDSARPLTAQGLIDADGAGKFIMQSRHVPDLVLCSPALRTQQTLEQLRQSLPTCPTKFDEKIYLAVRGKDLLEVLRHHVEASTQSVLLVGHNPAISDLLRHLTGETYSCTPGACFVLSLETDNWDEALASQGLWQPSSQYSPSSVI